MRASIAIIGAGRVGRALGGKLRERGWKILAVVARSEASARRAVRFIGAGRPLAKISSQVLAAQTILVTTPDSAIAVVGEELARIGAEELRGKVVLHTSGGLSAGALAPLREFGAAIGSVHPLQTFTGIGKPSLEGRIFTIEGDTAAVRVARLMARDLGGLPVQIASDSKAAYHAAATMVCGQVLAIMEAATRVLMSVGMKRREAVRSLTPLARQMLQNFERVGPKAAWTGPLARGDYGVIEAHVLALRKFPAEYEAAYKALNRLAARVLAQDSEGILARLDEISAGEAAKANVTGGQS
jgi:predicted short-subunit dehydrogenase-like oxidoreductase (DUF2520 family)